MEDSFFGVYLKIEINLDVNMYFNADDKNFCIDIKNKNI